MEELQDEEYKGKGKGIKVTPLSEFLPTFNALNFSQFVGHDLFKLAHDTFNKEMNADVDAERFISLLSDDESRGLQDTIFTELGKVAQTKVNTKIDLINAIIETGGAILRSCRKVGVHPNTHWNYGKEDQYYKEFVNAIIPARKEFLEKANDTLIESGDGRAIYGTNKLYNKDIGYGEDPPLQSPMQDVDYNYATFDELMILKGIRDELVKRKKEALAKKDNI